MRQSFWIQAVLIASLAGTAQSQGLEQKPDLSNSSVSITRADHKGRAALRVLDRLDVSIANDLVQLPVGTFKDGVIEADVAGLPAEGAPEGSRGFIGIAFRVQKDPEHYEAFYLRPTNGRSDDQLRRNHATNISLPPIIPGNACARRIRASTKAMSTWSRVSGSTFGSRSRVTRRGCSWAKLISPY